MQNAVEGRFEMTLLIRVLGLTGALAALSQGHFIALLALLGVACNTWLTLLVGLTLLPTTAGVLLVLAGAFGAGRRLHAEPREALLPLLVGVALFAASDRIRAARTFTGELTPPQQVDTAGPCRERLTTLGRALMADARSRGHYGTTDDPDFKVELTSCPTSGEKYRYYVSDDYKVATLFCSGHGVTNTPAFDFEHDKVSDTPLEPPKGSYAHYRWSMRRGEEAGYLAALEDIAPMDLDPTVAGQYRADVLNGLDRYQEALETLDKTNPEPDDDAAGIRALALLGLGRPEEALSVENSHGLEDIDALFALERDGQVDMEARQETGPIPSDYLWWVPLAQGRFADAATAAQRWLEQAGYGRPESSYAVMTVVLGLPDREAAKAVLKRGLRECRRTWPFPLLQVYNREITEGDIDPKTPGSTPAYRATEIAVWIGLLREVEGDQAAAREHFARPLTPGLIETRLGLSHGKRL